MEDGRQSTFVYVDPKTGLAEIVDIETGVVLARQRSPMDVTHEVDHSTRYMYDPVVAGLLVNEIFEGRSLTAACKKPGMPPLSVVAMWRRRHPEFTEMLNEARKMRAEFHRDRAALLLDNDYNKDSVPEAKFKFDGHIKLASYDHPEVYGNKSEVTMRGTGSIILETGIRREGDPGFLKDDALDVSAVHELGETDGKGNEETGETEFKAIGQGASPGGGEEDDQEAGEQVRQESE